MSKADQDVIREREEYVALSNRLIRQGHYDLTAQQMKITWGQNVPDDIGEIDPQKVAKQLLGGH